MKDNSVLKPNPLAIYQILDTTLPLISVHKGIIDKRVWLPKVKIKAFPKFSVISIYFNS
ncbi:MAG: hypothetical protein ACI9IP_003266 [Arcticibacterium sp.]|jgi:hypothetical protein